MEKDQSHCFKSSLKQYVLTNDEMGIQKPPQNVYGSIALTISIVIGFIAGAKIIFIDSFDRNILCLENGQIVRSLRDQNNSQQSSIVTRVFRS